MTIAILPLGISAVGGYLILNHGVIASFRDVAARQRDETQPTQRLRLLMWDTLVPVDEFVDGGDSRQVAAYRALRQRIETGFAELHDRMRSDPEPRTLVERARDDWTAADHAATEAISVQRAPGDRRAVELMDRFHGLISAAVDKLGAVHDHLAVDLRRDHDVALHSYERTEWLAGVAAAASMLMIFVGAFTIGHLMTLSVDRLVDGAARFAGGDREHRIEIRVPPELRKVAEEFNRMIVRIHEAEEVLADLARRDALTRLFNRRAFDEAFVEAHSRLQRLGEPVSLLMIDIDHFKKINDTYGHAAGDDVLRAVAETMASDVRVLDRVFRVGGEEFAILLPATGIAAARIAAERLREAIAARRIPIQGGEIAATVSIGAAAASTAAEASTLVEVADAALYRAKAEGRNRVVVNGEQDAAAGPQEGGDS